MSLQPGSAVGFVLVFFAMTWLLSIIFSVWLRYGQGRLRRKGARAERRAASVTLLLPVAIGGVFTGALVGLSYFGPALGIADHCLEHDHHLHLCLWHGGEWLTTPWVVMPTAMIAALLLVRMARLATQWFAAAAHLRRLRSVSTARELAGGTAVLCGPSENPYCLTAGIRSHAIYVGSAALDRLDDLETKAMIAHERAHIAYGDLWRRPLLALVSLLTAPAAGVFAFRVWRQASERLCDRSAAIAVGSPAPVAQAILTLARAPEAVAGCAFVPNRDQITDRIKSVLASEPLGESSAQHLTVFAAAALFSLAVAFIALANPIHHAIETALGRL